jgi:TolB-like protein
VPEQFMHVQWTRLPGALPTPQFVEQVKRLVASRRLPVVTQTARPITSPHGSKVGGAPRPRLAWIAAIAGAMLVGIFAWTQIHRTGETTQAAHPAAQPSAPPITQRAATPKAADKSIAVLPFDNLSDDKDATAFFADGMHDDILTNLTNIRELRVISRTTMIQYRNTKKTVPQIAAELGVAYILEGTVRRAGSRVRISGQLIDARADKHLWAQNYEKELNDVFAIQSAVAQEIAGALHAEILPQESKWLDRRPTANPLAYDLFLKARAGRDGLFRRDIRDARENFLKSAVQLDPKFAAAWAHLGRFYISEYITAKSPAALAGATDAIDRAIKLAPDDPEILVAIADKFLRLDCDFPRAGLQLERLSSLRPNFAEPFFLLSQLRQYEGRWLDALTHHQRLKQLEPNDVQFGRRLVTFLQAIRRYDEAAIEQNRVIRLDPGNLNEQFILAQIAFRARGSLAEIRALVSKLTPEQEKSPVARRLRQQLSIHTEDWRGYLAASEGVSGFSSYRMFALAAQGDRKAALESMGDLAAFRARLQSDSNWGTLAEVEVLAGNTEEAVRCAHKLLEIPSRFGAITRVGRESTLALVYAWSGQEAKAIAEYQRLLRMPYSGLNVQEMKRDPHYKPLREDLRFEALLNDPKNNAPLF